MEEAPQSINQEDQQAIRKDSKEGEMRVPQIPTVLESPFKQERSGAPSHGPHPNPGQGILSGSPEAVH